MKASLKILAVLFSMTLASVFIYIVATRDSKNAEEETRLQQQKERAQAQIARYRAKIKYLEDLGRQDLFTLAEIEDLKGRINQLEGKTVTSVEEDLKLRYKEGTPLFGGSKSSPVELNEAWELVVPNNKASFADATENGPVLYNPEKKKKFTVNQAIIHSSKSFSPSALVKPSDVVNLKNLFLEGGKTHDEQEIKGYLRFFEINQKPFQETPKSTPKPAPKPRLHSSKSLAPRSSVNLSDLERLRKLFLENKRKKETQKPK